MKIVRQEGDLGCGIACIAMICDKTFDDIKTEIKKHRNKTGASTSITDFETLLSKNDIKHERLKFTSWADLNGVYIVGVDEYENDEGNRGGWHWVVAIKNKDKFLILDPDKDKCMNYGDIWCNKKKKDSYEARENCDIIKCNIRFPTSIKI